ncbi:VOC family protein [Hoyosella sp. G463]|uniref:VOC family protein n=1 Tax=Lolliginicoccus lacisalsi TaxID=2742202 RepID=A0A927J8Z7_9ACTN|nr:VOC family protein [Lolliginicoccus lacisalsi]MBD8504896.1 VOC family protein [Lolliginicoccus lacisalsi]
MPTDSLPGPAVSSVLFASRDPERLRVFYEKALGIAAQRTPDGGYWVLDLGGFYLMLDGREDIEEHNVDPSRFILNIEVKDARAVAASIDATGASWFAPLEERDGSWFGTFIDPDGNHAQIIEISEQMRDLMEG